MSSRRSYAPRALVLRATILLAGALTAFGACASACSADQETPEPCTDIPAGGCPLSRGVACEDPACESVYACRPGNVWELDRRCPPGAAREAGVGAIDAGEDDDARAPVPYDAAVDAPPGAYGGPGCGPLQLPDCSVGLALACPSGCCGCEELYVCEGGGWVFWSMCE